MTRRGQATEIRPLLGSHFLVDFGDGKSRQASAGFAEVIFPEFRLGAGADGQPIPEPGAAEGQNTLLLRRGVWGALDLYSWWDKARRGKAPRKKTLKVQLLREDRVTIALTWTFYNVRPVALSYSPLRARESEVVIETLELAFDGFELS